MKKLVLLVLITIFAFFLAGCKDADTSNIPEEDLGGVSQELKVCAKPYIWHGADCCLDQNDNNICDEGEGENTQQEERVSAPSEESADIKPVSEEIVSAPSEESANKSVSEPTQKEPAEVIEAKISENYSLSDLPTPFIEDGAWNGVIVVGDSAPSRDVLAAIHIASSLEYVRVKNSEESFQANLPSKLASEVSDIAAQNAILIGSPCVNKHTAAIISADLSKCIDDYNYTEFDIDEGIIQLYETNDSAYLIVAGYSPSDTRNAAKVLSNFEDNNLDGNECIVPAGDWQNPICIKK